jgi:hypothetical protein
MSIVQTEAEEAIFDASSYDLPIPKDRYGRKADKLVVMFGAWEPDRTSEDDLAVFARLEKGQLVELRVRAFVTVASEVSKTSDELEETAIKRTLQIATVEAL